MKIIVGLGNPGKQYEHTRHNAGFLALDYLAHALNLSQQAWATTFDSQVLKTMVNDEKILLVKPQTFMNESGRAVRAVLDFYHDRLDPACDLIVIHDDIDLPLGTVRVATNSSSAGHKGVQNIIDELGKQAFHRIRIGIETRPSRKELPTEDFVLQDFNQAETQILFDKALPEVLQALKFIFDGKQ
jgi:PTH1 family peptidyl-tRNA hydrolase